MRFRAVAILTILLSSIAWHVSNAESPSDELKAVRGRIEALEKQVLEKEQTKQEAAKAVKHSEREVNDARKRLKDIEAREKAVQGQLKDLERKRVDLNGVLGEQRGVLSKLVYQQYLGGAPESLQLMLAGKDPDQVSRQLHYLTYVSKSRGKVIADLRENLAQLDSVRSQTADKQKELEGLRAEAQSEKKRLEKEHKSREGTLNKVATDIRKTQEEIEILRKNEQRLSTLVAHLARELARKSKQKRHKPQKHTEPSSDAAPFARLKGKLQTPVNGNVVNKFGGVRADSGLSWKGVVFATQPGESVKAVADGEVAYADTLRGFGKLLIIDHADGYLSLYGYNQTLNRKVGDKVSRGDKIATVGNGDGAGDSGLYFEIRVQGKPVDPMKWMTR